LSHMSNFRMKSPEKLWLFGYALMACTVPAVWLTENHSPTVEPPVECGAEGMPRAL